VELATGVIPVQPEPPAKPPRTRAPKPATA